MARLSEGVVSQRGETSQATSEGDSCEAAATVALPGAEPVLRSARELTVGLSGGGGCLRAQTGSRALAQQGPPDTPCDLRCWRPQPAGVRHRDQGGKGFAGPLAVSQRGTALACGGLCPGGGIDHGEDQEVRELMSSPPSCGPGGCEVSAAEPGTQRVPVPCDERVIFPLPSSAFLRVMGWESLDGMLAAIPALFPAGGPGPALLPAPASCWVGPGL